MIGILLFFAVFGFFWAVNKLIVSFYPLLFSMDETHFVETSDGWKLAVHRYLPQTPEAKNFPILLGHGLASNKSSFELEQETSLARKLSEQGFDVWVLELRGRGMSNTRSVTASKQWNFDDYLQKDIPVILELVLSKTQKKQLHWLGHSMGGLLVYSYLGTQDNSLIRSAIAVGSSLDYSSSVSGFQRFTKLRGLLDWIPRVPLSSHRLFAPLAGYFRSFVETFLYEPNNMSFSARKKLMTHMFSSPPSALLKQLFTAMDSEGLCSQQGIPFSKSLSQVKAPLFAVAGEKDLQCPIQAVEKTFQSLTQANKQMKIYGTSYGQEFDYGHFDLLLGKKANTEVFPDIIDWFETYDTEEKSVS